MSDFTFCMQCNFNSSITALNNNSSHDDNSSQVKDMHVASKGGMWRVLEKDKIMLPCTFVHVGIYMLDFSEETLSTARLILAFYPYILIALITKL